MNALRSLRGVGPIARCLAGVGLVLSVAVRAAGAAGPRLELDFNCDWWFTRNERADATAWEWDPSGWVRVRLPHDWAIAGPYMPEGDGATGKLPWRGEGWYRKAFFVPAEWSGKRVYLDFDGVMAMPTVYVNGVRAGGWDYGYVSFRVDATEQIRFGAGNVVVVHVDTRQHQSRWYPGAGIYRKVRMVVAEPLHVAHWGVFVTTPAVSRTAAVVRVQTTLENHTDTDESICLQTWIFNPRGWLVARRTDTVPIPGGGRAIASQQFTIKRPELWDIDSPRLYRCVTRVLTGDELRDCTETLFGIRWFKFTADDGFHLNGRRVQLRGVNLHHDLGPLGAAFNRRAAERQLQIMKDMGVNAIRTSHNPPAPEVLDLCDRMGILVWNEAFDKWDRTATRAPDVPVAEHCKKQLLNFVLRDRNHPCVVVWSVGNEIADLERGRIENGPALLRELVEFVRGLDPTRPVALACYIPESARTPLGDALDVIGWNYARKYMASRTNRPWLPIVYSESASALSTRGYYRFPHPSGKDDYSGPLRITSYDHCASRTTDIPDVEFARMEQDRFVAGEFVWSGFDYIGEPTPFVRNARWRPDLAPQDESRISLFGIVDLAGIPKDRYYLYRSYWAPEKKTIHIVPHWTWPDRVGLPVPVYVYTSGDSAELFLNGRSLGRRAKDPQAANVMDRYRLRWEDVVYEPGELRVVAFKRGRVLGTAIARTAGPPVTLRLSPDRTRLRADGEDLSFVLVEAVDKAGTVNPWVTNTVVFEVSGPAEIVGVANGDHHFPAEFQTNRVELFYGKAVVVLRTVEGRPGRIQLRAQADGLAPATTTLVAIPCRDEK